MHIRTVFTSILFYLLSLLFVSIALSQDLPDNVYIPYISNNNQPPTYTPTLTPPVNPKSVHPGHYTGTHSASFDVTDEQMICNFKIELPFGINHCSISATNCIGPVTSGNDGGFTMHFFEGISLLTGNFDSATHLTGTYYLPICESAITIPISEGVWEAEWTNPLTLTPTPTPTSPSVTATPSFTAVIPTFTATHTSTPILRATATVKIPPDLSNSNKIASKETIDYFELFDYIIYLNNNGGTSHVWITDTLPSQLSYIDGSLSFSAGVASYDKETATVYWNGVMNSAASVTITFSVNGPTPIIPHDTMIYNTVQIYDGVSTPFQRSAAVKANQQATPTNTSTLVPTNTNTPTLSATPTDTSTPTPSPTNTHTPTFTPTSTYTPVPSPTALPSCLEKEGRWVGTTSQDTRAVEFEVIENCVVHSFTIEIPSAVPGTICVFSLNVDLSVDNNSFSFFEPGLNGLEITGEFNGDREALGTYNAGPLLGCPIPLQSPGEGTWKAKRE